MLAHSSSDDELRRFASLFRSEAGGSLKTVAICCRRLLPTSMSHFLHTPAIIFGCNSVSINSSTLLPQISRSNTYTNRMNLIQYLRPLHVT